MSTDPESTDEEQTLRERMARAQFDAEGHKRRGIPERWENLPEGNREHRLGWADQVIDALDLHHMSVDYEWSDVDTFMFGVLSRRAYEGTHDRNVDHLTALDWVADSWLDEEHPRRKRMEMIAEATAAAADEWVRHQAPDSTSQDGPR